MEEVASRNKKNTATDSRETILTARSGCLARTFAASSCTESEMAMRRAMSTSNATNESRPCSVGVIFASDCSIFAREQQRPISSSSTLTVRGSAMNTMEIANTDATSSSSVIPASLAASINSLPMPNDTEKARSLPKEPRAVCASTIVPTLPNVCTNEPDLVNAASVEAAAAEGHYLPARLEWQAAFNGGAPLVLRRLFVCARTGAKTRGAGGPMRQRRIGKHGGIEHTFYDCAGTVFGATLGNVLQHCTNLAHGSHATKLAMASLQRVLAPAGRALASCTGEDVPFLTRGMACHRVMPGLARKLWEMKRGRKLDTRLGSAGVVIGAAAAILAAFECMAADPGDCDGLDTQLAACLRDAQVGLVGWRLPSMFANSGVCAARDAEVRALERARIGVSRAQEVGEQLPPLQRMRLLLDCFRRAAFPTGEDLALEGHTELLKRVRSGELVDVERDGCMAGATTAPGVATLAVLSALPVDGARVRNLDAQSDAGSASWPSSWGSGASQSSGGSSGSSGSREPTGGGFAEFGLSCEHMRQLAAAFQTQGLSLTARELISPTGSANVVHL